MQFLRGVILEPSLADFIFGSKNVHAETISFEGNHPSQFCKEGNVDVFSFLETKSTLIPWVAEFIPCS